MKLLKTLTTQLDQLLALFSNRNNRTTPPGATETVAATAQGNSADDDSPWEISSDSSTGPASGKDTGDKSAGNEKSVELISSSSAAEHGLVTFSEVSPEASRTFHSIQFTISCLVRLPIRKPAPLDRLTHQTALDTSPYQHFDIQYVQDKFPQLNADVARRLGKLITRRRQLIRYRKTHSEKLNTHDDPQRLVFQAQSRKEPEAVEAIDGENDVVSERNDAKSSQPTMQTKATTLRISEPSERKPFYASSIPESKSSAASTYATADLEVVYPPWPRAEDGLELEDFECPYCGLLKSIESTFQWK